MPISIEDRYKIMFEHHRFVSQFRLSLIRSWGAIYAALAIIFSWVNSNMKGVSWVICAIALFVTVLVWIAEFRHRPAIGALKDIGVAIEQDQDAGIPQGQRYFEELNKKGIRHGIAINWLAGGMIMLCLFLTIYLFITEGELPG